tara:strand:+ start:4562 stop:5149 length:588 start_codon:yes stop_codon:yes gene_type:complete
MENTTMQEQLVEHQANQAKMVANYARNGEGNSESNSEFVEFMAKQIKTVAQFWSDAMIEGLENNEVQNLLSDFQGNEYNVPYSVRAYLQQQCKFGHWRVKSTNTLITQKARYLAVLKRQAQAECDDTKIVELIAQIRQLESQKEFDTCYYEASKKVYAEIIEEEFKISSTERKPEPVRHITAGTQEADEIIKKYL